MIAVVVPTIRPESYKQFLLNWEPLFIAHGVVLITVWDGEKPEVKVTYYGNEGSNFLSFGTNYLEKNKELSDLVYNKNDGVRNYGFWVATQTDCGVIITLDDDTAPKGDTIQDHLNTLQKRVPISWVKSCSEYTRGFPYKARDEAPVMVSHGLWEGVADWDAPTQLVNGNHKIELYSQPVPKGIYFPFCGMNVAFRREMLPYMYYAPMGYKVDMDRFADIWLGIELVDICAKNNWAIYNGGAVVRHERASNVWTNLKKEVRGLELNETFWEGNNPDPYFELYTEKKKKWKKLIESYS